MKRVIFFLLPLIFFAFTACTSSQYVLQEEVEQAQEVPVFFQGSTPEADYEVLGFIETSGWIFTNKKQLLRGFTRKAEKLGADAVVDVEYFYIPHITTSIPAIRGKMVDYTRESASTE